MATPLQETFENSQQRLPRLTRMFEPLLRKRTGFKNPAWRKCGFAKYFRINRNDERRHAICRRFCDSSQNYGLWRLPQAANGLRDCAE
jgi:hypothetical protein